ncbi:MAG: YitT family protein, partial [Lachnospiraceae bacterium]|nr:YitT family protein [Lachnospiraceae bacterium]
MNEKMKGILREYGIITIAVVVMSLGTYFFKFPNHFAFGGVSGLAPVINGMTGISATLFTNVANLVLLVIGFIFLGKAVGVHTVYATLVMAVTLELLESFVPIGQPLTDEPLLELIFAVLLPAIGSAVLFNMAASSGGTDIIAMILRKYTDIHIGTALLIVDAASVILAFFVFGASVGLYSLLGLL